MAHRSTYNTNRSIHLFYAFLTLVALGILYWSFVMSIDHVGVIVEPQTLPPDGQSIATVRIIMKNRIGVEIPARKARITCAIEDGAGLAEIKYNADHTRAYVKAGTREGTVVLRVTSPKLAFPQEVTIRIRQPRA